MQLRRTVLAVGIGVFVVTLFGIPARATYGAQLAADEPQYLLTTLSLAEDGDLDIANQRYSGAYRPFHEALLPVQTVLQPDGSRLSPHGPMLPAYLALPMLLGGWVAAKVALAALAGTLAGLLVWVGVRRLGLSLQTAWVVVAVFGLSPPMAIYATQVYPEIAAALAVTVAIAALTGRPSRSAVAMLAMAVVALPWLAVKYVPVALVLAGSSLWWLRHSRAHLASLVSVLAGAGAMYLWLNQVVFGGWTPYAAGDFFVGGELDAMGLAPHYAGRSSRLLGLWVDRGFGLVAWQPAYLFAIPALAWSIRRRVHAGPLLVAVGGVGWLVASFGAQTMHGWWWPGRQVVVVLPVLILMVGKWIDSTRSLRPWFTGVGLLGVVAFVVVTLEAATGLLTLIVDFVATIDPFYRLLRPLFPDYLNPSPATWLLHGAWLGVFGGLASWGWRSGRSAGSGQPVELAPLMSEIRVA